MAAGIDVEAVFAARAAQMGVDATVLAAFQAARIRTMGSFAWSSSFQPGQTDEAPFVEMVRRTIGRDADDSELSSLRRLYYECPTLVLSDMRNRVERTEDSKPAKILPAERAARHRAQQARLTGIVLSGPNECSHALIDKVFKMLDDNVLRYIPLDEVTTREQELLGEKKSSDISHQIEADKSGYLKSVHSAAPLPADLNDNLKVKEAFNRRGLAFDQAGLISYDRHQAWVESLFHKLSEQPPPNYRFVSMSQIILADKKLFVRMAEDTRGGIAPAVAQPRPLDVSLDHWRHHNDVLFILSPLAGKGQGKSKSQSLHDESEWRPHPYGGKGSKGSKEGKRGKKGKAARPKGGKTLDLPPGCVAATPEGRRICFGFNRPASCPSGSASGSECIRGAHICGKCFGAHAAYECTRAGA